MRIALFGDIHANLEALNAVIEDATSQGCEQWVCLGDIVGYNANPGECLELIKSMECPSVKGNHDEDASGDHSLKSMNPIAATALEWTREQLSEEQRKWLRSLRMVRQVSDFTIVHSTLDQPQVWGYVTNKFDAMSNFSYQFTDICFHGHTHVPRVFVRGTKVREEAAELVEIEKKGLIPSWEELGLPVYDPKVLLGVAVVALPFFAPPGLIPSEISWIWGK